MSMRDLGHNRSEVRKALGGERADDHFHELAGTRDFYIYLTPNKKLSGYEQLRSLATAGGCTVVVTDEAPAMPGKGYKAVKITVAKGLLPEPVLRQAHRWAHARNFLHSFYKPAMHPTWLR
ncbi:MAG: hypothetical protein FJ318_06995 [SAR202 cluster bacterium]|nr:hypothetical protein [SAR202 cluster bacterium]